MFVERESQDQDARTNSGHRHGRMGQREFIIFCTAAIIVILKAIFQMYSPGRNKACHTRIKSSTYMNIAMGEQVCF